MRVEIGKWAAAQQALIAVISLLALILVDLSSPAFAVNAPYPGPFTLPAIKIGTAALISPDAANTYIGGRTVNAIPIFTLEHLSPSMPPEIVALARALKNDPDQIYEYVLNNVDTTWMYGLQKGPLGAEIDKSGTAFDQAALMIALLNQAGYKATYQIGWIELTPSQFQSWTNITSKNAACQLLANGGIPGKIDGTGDAKCSSFSGTIAQAVDIGHVWVLANIPNSSCGSNCLFDPAFKPYVWKAGISLASATGLGDTLGSAKNGSFSNGTIANGNVGFVQTLSVNAGSTTLYGTLTSYANNLLSCIESNCQNLPNAPQMEDIVGGGVIQAYTGPPVRQTSLPYQASGVYTTSPCNTVPPASICNPPKQYRTTLEVQGFEWNYDWTNCSGGEGAGQYDTMFDTVFFADQIYGRSLTVDTDYGIGMCCEQSPSGKYANTVWLRTDGITLATYVDPGICEGYNQNGPINVTSRGAPTYMTLIADHPYAASSDPNSTAATGTYMDQTVTKPVTLVTGLTIVNGWGDTNQALFTKLSDEQPGDSLLPITTGWCNNGDNDVCSNFFPGGTGNFQREKMAAMWLGQNARAMHLHAAIAGAAYQIHHELGFAYADNHLTGDYLQGGIVESIDYPQVDNFNRLDVDAAISLETRTPNTLVQNAAILAFAASSAALEGSVAAQLDDLPDTASTATRFEWANDPPGTSGSQDPNNPYEDPNGTPGARKFLQYTSSNYSNADSVVWVDGRRPTSNTSDTTTQGNTPNVGSDEQALWEQIYDNEVKLYANTSPPPGGNVIVTTSQEAFLGPGQRGGSVTWNRVGLAWNGYTHNPTKQRGPALVATFYDANNNPTAIAHDLVILSEFGSAWAGAGGATKGGGGGSEPNQQANYSPSEAADILKSHFVDKSHEFGVDLSNGSFGYTAPAKIDVGSGGFPYELTAELQFNPVPRPIADRPVSTVPPQPGWTSNWHNRLAMSGSGFEAMGKSDVRAAVSTIAAFVAAQNVYQQSQSLSRDVVGVLTQSWWADQLQGNVVTASVGASTSQFLETTPGNWILPGTDHQALTVRNSRTQYEQTCQEANNPMAYALSRGWDYTGMSFVVSLGKGRGSQNFVRWSNSYSTDGMNECGFAQGFRMSSWTFPESASLTVNLTYGPPLLDPQNPSSGKGFAQLLSVSNSLGREIDFVDNNLGNLVSFNNSLTGTDARSVSLGFTNGEINATSVTDPALAVTSFNFAFNYVPTTTQRPLAWEMLSQIFTPDNPSQPDIQYDYDGTWRVQDIQDAEALQVGDRSPWLFYIADGTRGERDDPVGDAWSVFYDTYGHPARYIDEVGNETDALFDSRGRAVQYVYPEGDTEQFVYDDDNNVTLYTKNPKPGCTSNCPQPIVVKATWNIWDKPATITDANNKKTILTYVGSGNAGASMIQTATRPADNQGNQAVYSYNYDSYGKLATATDPVTTSTSILTQYNYDGSENLTSKIVDSGTGELNLTTSYASYTANGDVGTTTDPGGFVTSSFYDNDRRKLEDDHHDGNGGATLNFATKTIFDALGRDIEEDTATAFSGTTVSQWAKTKTTQYTPTSKVLTVTDADLRTTTNAYDGADRLSTVTDPVLRAKHFAYDGAGNVLTEYRAWGGQDQEHYATYTYYPDGEKHTAMDADGWKAGTQYWTTFAYDGFNRLTTTTYEDQSTDQFGYDPNSNVTSHTNRNGCVINFQFDALNRMFEKDVLACGTLPAVTVDWAYDLGGRTLDINDNGVGNDLAEGYDTAGRLNSVATKMPGLGRKTTTYKFDTRGDRTRLTWPDGYLVNYAYDSLGRMSTATDPNSVVLATYGYDTFNRRTSVTYPSNASMTYTYTTAGDLQTLNHAMAGTANDVNYTLGYTNAHELNSEAASKTKFVWEPTLNVTTTDAYTPNKLNEYKNVTFNGQPQATFRNDPTGNLTFDGTWTYLYDQENRLLTANSTGNSATYAYDPKGRRNTKTFNGVTTNFLDDGDDEIAEYDGSGNLLRRYVPGPGIDEPIAIVPASGGNEYFHTDHHGSVIALSAADETLAEGPFLYDSYGNLTCTSNCNGGDPFKFTGQRQDPETGLYYYRARYYSAQLGRFLQVDPVGYTADMDLYTYVGNDPINALDPLGLEKIYLGGNIEGYIFIGMKYSGGVWYDTETRRVGTWENIGGGVGLGGGFGGVIFSGPSGPAQNHAVLNGSLALGPVNYTHTFADRSHGKDLGSSDTGEGDVDAGSSKEKFRIQPEVEVQASATFEGDFEQDNQMLTNFKNAVTGKPATLNRGPSGSRPTSHSSSGSGRSPLFGHTVRMQGTRICPASGSGERANSC